MVMRKSQSIKKLEELGLNTLDYFITKDKQEALHYLAKHVDDRISLRTERGDDFKCPFFYFKRGEDLVKEIGPLLSDGYTLLMCPSLDTKGCLAFGHIMVQNSGEIVMEFIFGEGTCRDFDDNPNKEVVRVEPGRINAVTYKDYPGKAHLINTIYNKITDIAFELDGSNIFEWSYYDRPVGVKSKNDIFWEIRNA